MNTKTHEIIELAWCDKTSFDSIKDMTGLDEKQVKKLMRRSLKPRSFKLWRKRVSGRKAKHDKLNPYTNLEKHTKRHASRLV